MSNILDSCMRRVKLMITGIFFLLVSSISVYSQTDEESLRFGEAAFADGDYYSASVYYGTLLQKDTNNISLTYKYAESCRLFNDYILAEKSYAKVCSSSTKSSYPLALFWLGWMKKYNGNYSDARNVFYEYYQKHSGDNDYYSRKAFHEIGSCEFAIKVKKDTVPVLTEHLGENINTPYSEFAPLQLGDTTLVFSTLRPYSEEDAEFLLPNVYLAKVFISKNTLAGWAKAKEWKTRINDDETNNANTSVNTGNKRIYFTRCTPDKVSEIKCAIYTADFVNGKWQSPVKLSDKINLPGYSTTQPAISKIDSAGIEVLYFSSNRPGGFGKNDIWYSMISKGKYSDPVNLGSFINTEGDEISPFYDNKKGTLFFSSDWHNGLGGFDVFKSKGALNDWTLPKNMGFPLNTSYNDIYFTVNENDSDGFFTSNRPGSFFIKGETCCNDIYSYEWQKSKAAPKNDTLIVLKDTVNYEQSIKDLLPLTLYFHNDIPGPASWDTVTTLNYQSTLADYIQMKTIYKAEYSKGLTGNAAIKAEKDIDEFFENYVSKGFTKLEQFSEWLLKDLEKGREVNITVKGYCSPLNTTAYNVNLAKRRISSLQNFFKEYNYGVFLPYLNGTSADGGKLNLYEDPVGESMSNAFVSDNPNDQRNSIYSRAAALERKIQIILYESKDTLEKKIKKSDIKFLQTVHNFGKITAGSKKVISFSFQNTGSSELLITGVETSCGCVISDFPVKSILPGAHGQINVLYDTKDEIGNKSETITVYSNSVNPKVELVITAEVLQAPVIKETPQQPKKTVPKKPGTK
jgi:hypothetical protein